MSAFSKLACEQQAAAIVEHDAKVIRRRKVDDVEDLLSRASWLRDDAAWLKRLAAKLRRAS